LKIKLKVLSFGTVKVIEVQVVLNTLTELIFQDPFKKWQKCWDWCIRTEGEYFKGDGGQ
jgi:hypothetical protein